MIMIVILVIGSNYIIIDVANECHTSNQQRHDDGIEPAPQHMIMNDSKAWSRNNISCIPFAGSSVDIGSIRVISAWPLLKDDAYASRSRNGMLDSPVIYYTHTIL